MRCRAVSERPAMMAGLGLVALPARKALTSKLSKTGISHAHLAFHVRCLASNWGAILAQVLRSSSR